MSAPVVLADQVRLSAIKVLRNRLYRAFAGFALLFLKSTGRHQRRIIDLVKEGIQWCDVTEKTVRERGRRSAVVTWAGSSHTRSSSVMHRYS